MENLPEALNSEIIKRLSCPDRNSLSLVSKLLYKIVADTRRSIRVAIGLKPVTEILTKICFRFPNLTKVELTYFGWKTHSKRKVDNQGLSILSTNCPSLTDLTISHCSFMTDSGLSNLASCEKLKSLKLSYITDISSAGLLSVLIGCKNLSTLHLMQSVNFVTSAKWMEWLEYVGKMASLEDLSIVRCHGINENGFVKLGNGLRRLKRFEFERHPCDLHTRIHNPLVAERLFKDQICCESLKEVNLFNCDIGPGSGLSLILGSCGSLEKVCLDMCSGLADNDIISLSKKSHGLKSISLERCSTLTDASLKALGRNCPFLENVELAFWNLEPLITIGGILALVNGCSIKALVLKDACFLNDSEMKALSLASSCLETLEVEWAKDVTNWGIGFVINFPRLVNLKINGFYRITDGGLKPLIERKKFNCLMIKNCPLIHIRAGCTRGC